MIVSKRPEGPSTLPLSSSITTYSELKRRIQDGTCCLDCPDGEECELSLTGGLSDICPRLLEISDHLYGRRAKP